VTGWRWCFTTDPTHLLSVPYRLLKRSSSIPSCGCEWAYIADQHVADDLLHYERWRPHLYDLGECDMKHGVRVHVFNLYTEELGNPELPEKFRQGAPFGSAIKSGTFRWALLIGAGVLLVAVSLFIFDRSRAIRLKSTGAQAERNAISLPVAEKSIAVLPFENLSEDKANAYFADGIQEEILARLSKIADLKVISRTSTQHYKSAPENLRDIASQLGVAHILEGSVQKSGDAVRVNVQLIKAANDSHVWADTFDRKLTDIFSVESDVAKAVADQLRAKLTGQEKQVIATKPTDNPEAYDAYLRGLAYTLKTVDTPANALAAQKYLREAVRLDPQVRSWLGAAVIR
jgi:TolB-like protein